MENRKMIITFSESQMSFTADTVLPAKGAAEKFRSYVRDRAMELLDVDAETADAMMEDDSGETDVCYNEADACASIRASKDGWEHLTMVDIPDDRKDKWLDMGFCRFLSEDARLEIKAVKYEDDNCWRLRDRLTGRTEHFALLDICKKEGALWTEEYRAKKQYKAVLSARLLFNNDEEVVRRAKVYLAEKNVDGFLGIDPSFETVAEMMSSLFPGIYGVDLTRFHMSIGYCYHYLGEVSVTCDWFWVSQGLYDALKPALSEGSSFEIFLDKA